MKAQTQKTPLSNQKTTPQKASSFDLKEFVFLWDFILVKTVTEGEVNGLVKPDQYDDRQELGLVIAVGDGKVLEDGSRLPMPVKVGDIIFYGKYASEQTRVGGEDYYLIRAEDVRAVRAK